MSRDAIHTPPGSRPTGPPRLEVRDLAVSFKVRKGLPRKVLEGLSFSTLPGEIFGLLGPNGSGKSTTFHVLTGGLRPDAGTLLLDGVPIAPGAAALRRQMGVVFQSASVDINLTCRENLQLAARLHCVPARDATDRIRELLALADLTDRADERVKTLSGGMKRRLELSRALIHRPRLLLLDEPTVGLDEASFERTWRRLAELRAAEGVTLLLSTHRPEEAARCDRIALLDQGRIVALDTPANLQARVAGDVITLHGADLEALAAEVRARFNLEAKVVGDGVTVLVEAGHTWIPRLVEAFPPGRLTAVNLHRPSLADVFLSTTGHTLFDVEAAA